VGERERVCVCEGGTERERIVYGTEEDLNIGRYGVAMNSKLLKIIGLFCKRALSKRLYSAKETYDFKEPTNRSHPITAVEVIAAGCVSI